MSAQYQQLKTLLDPGARRVSLQFVLVNHSDETWRNADGYHLGWQIFDPESHTFIAEGAWIPLPRDLAPAETVSAAMEFELPPEKGRYHVYVSVLRAGVQWLYEKNSHFILIDASVEHSQGHLLESGITTLRKLRSRNFRRNLVTVLRQPIQAIAGNRSLIRSMVRRDILSRYRGSFGDVFWTVLNPLLLTATYFFVFGVVLQSRFGPDNSRTGFALYFLAGMLPWLAFSEAIGRSPYVIVEHRNFVKKLIFPVEILPVNQMVAGLVSEAFALVIFLAVLLAIEGSIPATITLLPLLIIPQAMFTLGMAWFFAALGVYLRDIGQVMGFLLTLWFFLTPICYPEASLPSWAAAVLTKNPIYVLVRGYRSVLLEGVAPSASAMWKLWLLAVVVFFAGHAWFYKLRKGFADVI